MQGSFVFIQYKILASSLFLLCVLHGYKCGDLNLLYKTIECETRHKCLYRTTKQNN